MGLFAACHSKRYQHRYLQASWDAYTANDQSARGSTWHDANAVHAFTDRDRPPTDAGSSAQAAAALADGQVLRGAVEAQQAVLAGLRAQQQADGAAADHARRAVNDLGCRWVAMEAWQQEAEPRLAAGAAAVGRFGNRLDAVQVKRRSSTSFARPLFFPPSPPSFSLPRLTYPVPTPYTTPLGRSARQAGPHRAQRSSRGRREPFSRAGAVPVGSRESNTSACVRVMTGSNCVRGCVVRAWVAANL